MLPSPRRVYLSDRWSCLVRSIEHRNGPPPPLFYSSHTLSSNRPEPFPRNTATSESVPCRRASREAGAPCEGAGYVTEWVEQDEQHTEGEGLVCAVVRGGSSILIVLRQLCARNLPGLTLGWWNDFKGTGRLPRTRITSIAARCVRQGIAEFGTPPRIETQSQSA